MARWLCIAGWLLALCPTPAAAQEPRTAELTGTVVDDESGLPLESVHVFIATSMIGTATDSAGRFHLRRVPAGAHTLYVTMLGYEPLRHPFVATTGRSLHISFRLKPAVLEGPEVIVTAKRDKRWQKRLDKFTRLFIGETANAGHTKIVNAEVLNFDATWYGKFTALASAPLVIENEALGYRVTYFLKEFQSEGSILRFDGEPLFEERVPANDEQRARWDANRRKAYYGSFRQFMQSLFDVTCKEAGFRTYLIPRSGESFRPDRSVRLDPKRVVKEGPAPDQKSLSFYGFIEVVYEGEEEEEAFLKWEQQDHPRRPGYQRSWIELSDGPTTFDRTGEVLDPYGITVYGYFAFERIADMLPKEYYPSLHVSAPALPAEPSDVLQR